MSFKSEFSPHQEKKLVEMVERHPCIYDVSSQLYKDLHLKENAWKETAKRVGRPAEQCKWRWRNIKDTYVKRKRKGKLGQLCTEASSSVQKKWHLAAMLKFLDEIQFKKRSNITGPTNNEQSTEFIGVQSKDVDPNENNSKVTSSNISNRRHTRNGSKATEITTNTNKMADVIPRTVKLEKPEKTLEKTEIPETLQYQEDHVDVFFRSVALSVKQFPRHLINQAKLRTLQMLVDLEGKCLTNEHNFTSGASTDAYYDDNSSS